MSKLFDAITVTPAYTNLPPDVDDVDLFCEVCGEPWSLGFEIVHGEGCDLLNVCADCAVGREPWVYTPESTPEDDGDVPF